MSTNSLGPFQFLRVDRGDVTPNVLTKRSAIAFRPGVAGTAVIDMATGGEPFPLPTLVDIDGRENAEAKLKAYRAAIIEDKLDLVWSDINYTAVHETQYVILQVLETRIEPVAGTSGGLVGGNHLVYATFILLPVSP